MQSTSDKCKQQKEKKYGVSYWSLMTKVTVTQCFSCNKRSYFDVPCDDFHSLSSSVLDSSFGRTLKINSPLFF